MEILDDDTNDVDQQSIPSLPKRIKHDFSACVDLNNNDDDNDIQVIDTTKNIDSDDEQALAEKNAENLKDHLQLPGYICRKIKEKTSLAKKEKLLHLASKYNGFLHDFRKIAFPDSITHA